MQSWGLLQHCLQQHLSVPSQVLGGPYRRVPQAVPLCPLPLSPPNQAFPSSCAACWAHTAHGGSAPLCRAAVLHPSPERAEEKVSAVTQQRGYSRKGCLGSLVPATALPALQ